jgi:transmembrane 9 superfamily member 2/4
MPLTWKRLVAILSVALILQSVAGFYIPGVKPQTFQKGDPVALNVNSMTSIHTQVPKDYYHLSFCRPRDGPKMANQNLGEFLTGNKIQSSPYLINMLEEAYCTKLCQVKLSKLEAAKMKLHIKYGYHNNWIIDNLPSAVISSTPNGEKMKHYAGGFPIGFIASDVQEAYIYNHLKIIINYHQRDPSVEEYSVVGFNVEPMSVKHEFQGGFEINDGFAWDGSDSQGWSKQLRTCSTSSHLDRNSIRAFQKVEINESILYSYDVTWYSSDTVWASRWDIYLNEDHLVPAQVHWYPIIYSVLVVLFLSLLVIIILVRNVKRDIAGYNEVTSLEDQEKANNIDEPSWKLVHADVFRAPDSYPILYAVFIGTGVQIFFTTLGVICLSAVGFLSPARRGLLMIAVLIIYMLCGVIAGYISSRLYLSFRGSEWQLCTILTATLYPGICFCIFLFFNIYLFFLHSSGSVPLIVILILLAMWCFIAIPLVFLGACFGYKEDVKFTLTCLVNVPIRQQYNTTMCL